MITKRYMRLNSTWNHGYSSEPLKFFQQKKLLKESLRTGKGKFQRHDYCLIEHEVHNDTI